MSKPVPFLALVLSLWLAAAPCRVLEAAAEEPPKGSVGQALACKSPVELVRTSLQLMLSQLDLTISVKDDVLLITTRPRQVPFRGAEKHGSEEEDR